MTAYEFTAYSEADLVHGNLNCGDTFTVPDSATTCITVYDNDPFLSGDNRCNENANDRYGQHAKIEGPDGDELGNHRQIYAESYHIVKDAHGNKYVLIEIEQEGTNDDYFTFYTGHGFEVPPAGTELTVVYTGNVKGNWVDYKCLDAGEKEPEFRECDDPDAVLIDFNDLNAGDTVDNQFPGVTITAQRRDDDPDSENDAMVFDSANPTGGDTDLATANQGNVLIVSEDNDASDPDDNIGGSVEFVFDNAVDLRDIKVIDTEEGGTIELFDRDGNLIDTVAIPQIGDGEIDQVLIDTTGVVRMVVTLNGSGAIDDICYIPTGALSGRYFCDENNDDIDNDEPGIEGKLVTLIAADGNVVATTTTGPDGSYRFNDLQPGDYTVMFEDSADIGKDFIAPNAGNDDAVDSDVIDAANGKTAPVTVRAGEETKDVDAGVEDSDPRTGAIGDTVWLDVFGDGILNDEALDPFFNGVEQGVDGVTVQLKDADTGEVLAEQVTANGGKYLFENLAAGNYQVGFILPDGFEFTAQDQGGDDARDSDADPSMGMTDVIVLAQGEVNLTVDAGLIQCGDIVGTSQGDPNSPVGGYDLLVGCDTDDDIRGRSGEDTVFGNGGNDEISGDSFNDTLFGGDGNDDIDGGSQNDVLQGDAGDDILDGGSDRDTAVFAGNFADADIQIVDLFTGELSVTTADGTDTVRNIEVLRFDDGEVEVDALVPGGSRDTVAAPAPGGSVNIDVLANDIELSEGSLSVIGVNSGAFGTATLEADGTVTYTTDADFGGYDFFSYTVSNGVGFLRTVEVQVGDRPDLASEPGAVVLADFIGTDGNDFVGTSGVDIVVGGTGFDTIRAVNGGDSIDGGSGNDRLEGGGGEDLLLGGDGDDTIGLDNADDIGFGEEGDDLLIGRFDDDVMFGGNGNDRLRGNEGSDQMFGGAGDDRFEQFRDGSDVAIGGSGDDTFLWDDVPGGRDLLDGESGVDRLEITLDAGTDAVAVQAEIDAYLAIVAANEPPAGSINDGSVSTGTFSFTAIELDIRDIEQVIIA
ncbi:MAG: SdrD B-like domain-containing protein [Pseudomonadota bacterium]